MVSLANGRFPLRLGLHELNTEQRGTRSAAETGWTCPNGPTGLGLFWAGSCPFFSLRLILIFCTWPLHLCHFEVIITAIKTKGSLCMNFRSFHLNPREFSTQAHWSLPPLEASWHVVGAP
jgi:hypothetical protein